MIVENLACTIFFLIYYLLFLTDKSALFVGVQWVICNVLWFFIWPRIFDKILNKKGEKR